MQLGESNWLLGFLLTLAYFIISVGMWVHPDEAALHQGDFTLPG
jgi:heme A synthase